MSIKKGSDTVILGISAFYHDSAAALIVNGEIVSAAQEERFTRIKHDAQFPSQSIQFCLASAAITLSDIDYVAFYDKPLPKFERLLETYLYTSPKGLKSFVRSMPVWLKEKLFLKSTLRKNLSTLDKVHSNNVPLLFSSHHQAHAASAFYPSPFDEAVILCLDGVGEWETSTLWRGCGDNIHPLKQINFPHSIGLLYSAFTYYLGFKVNSGEYKMMGLAPYGVPRYVDTIKANLIDIKEDGSFRLNLRYFDFCTGLKMINPAFCSLFNQQNREPESEITQFHMDIAASIQRVTEEVIFKLVNHAVSLTQITNLCLAGGVALNCVANGKIINNTLAQRIWIQPAAGDDGGALGAALAAYHQHLKNVRKKPLTKNQHISDEQNSSFDQMKGSYLGPDFSSETILKVLNDFHVSYKKCSPSETISETSKLLAAGNIVGWFQGKMEFGPRSLGNRSILADPRSIEMQSKLNLKIKQRESFRPFAPAVLREKVSDYFDTNDESPYMLLVSNVDPTQRLAIPDGESSGLLKLKEKRSTIPAVTHVDYSARVQTVDGIHNPMFYDLLSAFEQQTGCAVLVNTSFNVRGEPVVCTPKDALSCFMRTDMDYLVIGNVIIDKKAQTSQLKAAFSEIKFKPD